MVDQVNPTSSFAPGIPLAQRASAMSRSAPQSPSPAESARSSAAAMEQTGSELRFQVDPGSGRAFFQIVSQTDGEVLFQTPSPEMLAAARRFRASAKSSETSGILMDKEG
jgi:uncharacterized FlaG/YvyC family protein